jgi:excisionase family DNA binding protein
MEDLQVPPAKLLYTEAEAARLLGFSLRFLQEKRYKGGGPNFCRIGSRIRYRLSDLDAFLEQNVRTSTSDTGRRVA